jgi:hypothetical protein
MVGAASTLRTTTPMKIKQLLITGTCVAALTLCLPVAYAQSPSPSPKSKASPTAKAEKTTTKSETKETTATDKPARSIPFRGDVNEVDSDDKTFTIGKTTKRTLKVTDKTKVTKDGEDASFTDITAGTYVTGSYWKQEDGTLEARTVKVGGSGDKKTTTKKTSKKKTDDEEAEGEE